MVNPLVSIVVVTYNSARTITDTLASILQQTYEKKNIEIIFADDCSADETKSIIAEWITEHESDFYAVKCHFAERNCGVTINCNNGWHRATGQWIKSIAGDDMLHPECIEKNINFVLKNNVVVLFSKMQPFGHGRSIPGMLPGLSERTVLKSEGHVQLDYLLKTSISGAPTSFFNAKIFRELGFGDESYSMLEDYPLWVKYLKNDYSLSFMDELTVYYRIDDSISRGKETFVNLRYFEDLYQFEKKVVFVELEDRNRILLCRKKIWYFLMSILLSVCNNKRGFLSNLVYKFLLILRPGVVTQKIRALRGG